MQVDLVREMVTLHDKHLQSCRYVPFPSFEKLVKNNKKNTPRHLFAPKNSSQVIWLSNDLKRICLMPFWQVLFFENAKVKKSICVHDHFWGDY